MASRALLFSYVKAGEGSRSIRLDLYCIASRVLFSFPKKNTEGSHSIRYEDIYTAFMVTCQCVFLIFLKIKSKRKRAGKCRPWLHLLWWRIRDSNPCFRRERPAILTASRMRHISPNKVKKTVVAHTGFEPVSPV